MKKKLQGTLNRLKLQIKSIKLHNYSPKGAVAMRKMFAKTVNFTRVEKPRMKIQTEII